MSGVGLAANQDQPLVVVKNGRYGFINHRGKIIIKPKFIWAEDFGGGFGEAYVCGRYVSINPSGNLLPLRITNEGKLMRKTEGEKTGFIGTDGQFMIAPIFDDALDFSEGLAAVRIDHEWGFIDTTGNLVIKPQFNDAFYFEEGVGLAELDSGHVLIDRSGRVLASGLEFVDGISDGRVPASRDGKFGYFDLQGHIAIPFIYDSGASFSGGLAAVVKDDRLGYLDRDGNVVIPFMFDYGGPFDHGLAPARIGTRTGFIDKSGKFSFYLKFDGASGFGGSRTDASSFWTADQKFGYVNTSGRVIWGPVHETPDHPPIFGWPDKGKAKSCEGVPKAVRTKIAGFPPQ